MNQGRWFSGRWADKFYLSAFLLAGIIFIFTATFAFAVGQWSVNTSAQVTKGNYIFDSNITTYYFYGGFRFQTDRWSMAVNLPIIGQNNDLVTRTGGLFLPTGGMHHNENNEQDPFAGGMMGDDNNEDMHGMFPSGNLTYGLGDLYLYYEFQVLQEQATVPSVSLNSQTKVPTASQEKNYGTGEFDYGLGVSFRKSLNDFTIFMDIGFLVIGDPPEVTFNDPVTFGLGIGKFFNHGRSSLQLYYQSYSEILPGYQAPSQVSLGFYFRMHRNLTVSLVGLAGLSETSPGTSFSSGLQFAL